MSCLSRESARRETEDIYNETINLCSCMELSTRFFFCFSISRDHKYSFMSWLKMKDRKSIEWTTEIEQKFELIKKNCFLMEIVGIAAIFFHPKKLFWLFDDKN